MKKIYFFICFFTFFRFFQSTEKKDSLSNYDYLKWLCQNFNLTMIIKYNFCISKYRNGLLIHYKDSNGFEKWLEYDENNNLIYHKNSNEFEYWKKYNENNELIFINILSIRFNETI